MTSSAHHKSNSDAATSASIPIPQPRLRPISPLSPRPHDYSNMAQPARRGASRPSSSHRTASSLKLPSLPRFHPANFSSQSSSFAPTPISGSSSPQPPMSPRSQQRQYSDVQKQLYAHQRELLANAGKIASKGGPPVKPVSPRLAPAAGSPGPVTPLELEAEQAGGYLLANQHSPRATEQAQRDYVERMIREEAARRGELSPKRTTTVGSY